MTDKPNEMLPDVPTQMDENQLALFGKILHTHMPHWKEWIDKLIAQAQGVEKMREALREIAYGDIFDLTMKEISREALKGNE